MISTVTRKLLPAALLGLVLLFSACAPRATNTSDSSATPSAPQAQQTEETAEIAYHRMAIGFLQTGEYTTNVLLELSLPKGVKWTLEAFSTTDYRLRFTSDDVSGYAWLVTPEGVRVTRNS